MTINTVGKLAFAALTLTALAGCVTAPPPPPPAQPVIVTTPTPATSPSVVVTPHAY
jgi:hypothetical protein